MFLIHRQPRMKILIPLFIAVIGCTPVHHYTYQTSLDTFVPDNKMRFENDTLRISFLIEPESIAFKLENKLDKTMQINWDEMNVLINKENYKVMRTELGVFKAYQLQHPTIIEGNSYTTSQLVPARNLKMTS